MVVWGGGGYFTGGSDKAPYYSEVDNYSSLPSASLHQSEIWFVRNASGGALSLLGIYKYPKGFYKPNSSLVWERLPLNVKVSEDTVTMVNLTDWSEFNSWKEDVLIGDRLIYNSLLYENKTGSVTSTSPDSDTTNWRLGSVMGYNPVSNLYIRGEDGEEDSLRFSVSTEDYAQIERYSESVWAPTELIVAYGTLFFGHNLALSAAGDQLISENVDKSKRHLYSRTEFSGTEGTEELKVAHLDSALYHNITISDDTNEFSGTSFSYVVPPLPFSFYNERFYLKIGSIDATSGVTINIYRGLDNTYPKRFSQIYSPSKFSKTTDGVSVTDSTDNPGTARFTLDNNIELWEGQEVTSSGFTTNTDYNVTDDVITSTGESGGNRWYEIDTINYGSDETGTFFTREIVIDISDFYDKHDAEYSTFEYTSNNTFSFKTNASGSVPWLASDFYTAYHDEVLITKEWTQYDARTAGEWYISHNDKKIYEAKTNGTKSSAFTSEKDNDWMPLTTDATANRVQATGLLSGSVISQASSTTVDWTSGKGQIADYTVPTDPVITPITWNAVSGYTPINIATDGTSVFGYDDEGSLVEFLATAMSPQDQVDYIFFGSCTHLSGSITSVQTDPGNLGYGGIDSFRSFIQYAIGPANVSGNIYSANGSNLNIDILGGEGFFLGSNFRNNTKIPDIVTLTSGTAISFSRVYNEADPSLNITYESLSTGSIDPTKYDDGSGTLQNVTTDYWTIQHIYRSRNGATLISYGQTEYATKALATEAIPNEIFNEKSPLPWLLFRSYLVVKQSATDLSDTNQAEFFECSSFRTSGISSSTSTVPGITSPGGSDGNVQYNNANVFGGESTFTYNDSTNTLTVTNVTAELTPTSILANGVIATTQSPGDNSTKVATTAYVDEAVLVEDLWDRSGTVLSPKNSGDSIQIETAGSASIYVSQTGNAYGAYFDLTGITSTYGISLSGLDNLVSGGRGLNIYSNSSNFGYNIANFEIGPSGSIYNSTLRLIHAGGGNALYSVGRINEVSNTITGTHHNISAETITTGDAFYVNSSSLTSGRLAYFYSNSTDTSERDLVLIENSNSAATGSVGLKIIQNSTDYALEIDAASSAINVTGDSLFNGNINASGSINSNTDITLDDLSIDLTVPGVIYNINHLEKVDETHINIYAGEANIRKASGSVHRVSWEDNLNYAVSLGLTIPWVTYEWNVGETDIQLNIRDTLPTTLEELEQIAVIGRVWVEAGILYASSRHMLLANDRYTNRSQAWKYPSYNYSVVATYSAIDSNYIALSTGELFRWPIVAETTGHHTHYFSGDTQITYIWGHLQGQATHDEIEDDAGGDEFDIADISNWYDNGGVATAVPNNKFVIHQIGAYAVSEVLVWFRGQNVYDSMAEALSAVQSESLTEASWASDTSQISKIAWVILKQNTTDFSDTASCRFITVTGSGTSAGTGVTNWTELTDTPSSYTGHANKIVHLNSGESALEFTDNLKWDNTNSKLTLTTNSITSGYGVDVTTTSTDVNQWSLGRFAITDSAAVSASALTLSTASPDAVTLELIGGQVSQTYTGTTGIGYLYYVNSLTTGTALQIEGSSLTTGKLAYLYSDSSDTSYRPLMEIINDNSLATSTSCLVLRNDAIGGVGILSTGRNVLQTNTGDTNNSALTVNGTDTTTGYIVNITGGELTTGQLLRVYSNSVDTSPRNLVEITNDSPLATGATALHIKQDADALGVYVSGIADPTAATLGVVGRVSINSNSTTTDPLAVIGASVTTGRLINVVGDVLTTGKLARFYSNSSNTSSRNLIEIINNSNSATGAVPLFIDQNADQNAIFVDAENTTSSAIVGQFGILTTGIGLDLYSNSSGGAFKLASIAAGSGATDTSSIALSVQHNGLGVALDVSGTSTTSNVSNITGNNLTTGNALNISSTSTSSSLTLTEMSLTSGASVNAKVLVLDHAGSNGGTALDMTGNMRFTGTATTATSFDINGNTNTTGNVVDLYGSALTTASLLRAYSNSADTSSRSLIEIINDNVASTNTIALDIQQDGNSRGIRLNANGITTGIGLDVYANGLTSGNAASFYSDGSSISARNLVQIINDNVLSTGTTALYIRNDTNNLSLDIDGAGVTSSRVVNIEANSISSGQILRVYSNSSDSTVRALTYLVNDNVAATGARLLQMQQDADAISWYLDQNGDGNAIYLDGTGNTTHDCIRVDANNITTASIARFYSNSTSTSSRNLIEIINDNVLADGVVSLYVQNDADAIAIQANGDVEIGGDTDMIGSDVAGNVLDIDGDTLTTGNALYAHADSLTTGYIGYFYSNSADTSTRRLVEITNDNPAATGTTCLYINQDSTGNALIVTGKTSFGGDITIVGNINQTGRLGIGTSPDADADLHILTSSGDIISRLESESLSTTNRATYQVIGNSGSGDIYAELGVVYYDQSSSGGTNGPCAYLHLQAGDGGTNYLWTDNSDQLRIGSLGQVGSTNGTVVGTQTSDLRVKDVLQNCPYGLSEVLQLNSVQYKLNYDIEETKHLGFLAQEVIKVIPEAVYDTGTDIDGTDNTLLNMSYTELIPVLVNAIKELTARVEELEK